MKIVIDENVLFGKETFSLIGEVTSVPGRLITPGVIKDDDILVVRSVTKVDEQLLGNSNVKFVGSATAGIDHVDTEYLKSRGIGFASAPGSNSNSVAEYFTSALLLLDRKGKISLDKLSLGIVGVGHVGSKVVKKAEGLGIEVLQNDPPLKRETKDKVFRELDELMDCDVITLHVPLYLTGEDKTLNLFDEKRINKMKRGSVLINTSRGKVVEEFALKSALREGHLSGAILDVWSGEPDIDREMLELVDIGTSHIAGYSYDGKVKGTRMVFDDICEFLSIDKEWKVKLPPPEVPYIEVAFNENENFAAIMSDVVFRVYDIKKDDNKLRKILNLEGKEKKDFFDALRANYRVRREFFNTRLKLSTENENLKNNFRALGFDI
ncbi:4-phosphoerythronate dehydrogenase [candidate division WOR-3 bacterium]|nr:4-phosphoerythronate dehydrogenase [candidate division WOR-3 bacterium]